MRKLVVLLVSLLGVFSSRAQLLAYNFSASQGNFVPVSGGSPVSTTLSAADFLGDSKTSVLIPLGFLFNFDGLPYSGVVVASDGFISFNPLATTTSNNSLSGAATTRRPLVAPLWDDLNGASGSAAATYITTGAVGSRIFTVEWLNWQWNYMAAGPTISFQVKLYEGTNKIDFIYRQESGGVNSGTASIGIARATTGPGNFWSLSSPGASPIASSAIEISTISAKPATGQVYSFTPSIACAGVLAGGVTINNSVPTCANSSFILDINNATVALGLTYQWQSSNDGSGWSDVPLAISSFYSVSALSSSTYFRRKTTCSGTDVFSTPLLVTITGAPDNDDFCAPVALTAGGSPHCANTTCATSANDPSFPNSSPNNTVWYSYTPAVTGSATIIMSRPDGLGSGFLNGWIGIFTRSGACPAPVLTEVPSLLSFDLNTNSTVTLITPTLTAGTPYLLMIDGNLGASGSYCIQVATTLPPPSCTSNIGPASGSVSLTSSPMVTWNPSPLAISYDLMVSTDSGATYAVKATVISTNFVLSGLTPSATYYWYVIPKNSGGSAAGCQTSAFSLTIGALPSCPQSYVSPASNSINVPVNSNTVFEWSAVSGATSYDHYLGTTNPPLSIVKNSTGNKDTIVLLLYNTKYYWSIAPKNGIGSNLPCLVDSFTTTGPVTNCIPLYDRGVSAGDSLVVFRLNGEAGTQLFNAPALSNSSSYSDYYNASNITLGVGNSYIGFSRAGASSNRISVWIDYNNNSLFEYNERLLNNQDISSSPLGTYFSLYIPASAAVGEHRMRVRNIYNQVLPVDPCALYQYGEAEDYKVTIQNSFAVRPLSAGAANNCFIVAPTTIDTASNNTTQMVPLLDTLGNIVAAVNAAGNNLAKLNASALYLNSGPVRTSGNNIKFLDRNYMITPGIQPVSPVTVRLYFTNGDLLALQAADPLVSSRGALNLSKTGQTCSAGGPTPSFATFYPQSGGGTYGTGHFADFSIPSFSEFYLHGGLVALPVNLVSFKGQRIGSKNTLGWTTSGEVNNKGFELERSADGTYFTTIAYIAPKTPGSSFDREYNFDDLTPGKGTNYYRLKQIDKDEKATFSSIVIIKSSNIIRLELTSLYPNPAQSVLNMVVVSPGSKRFNFSICDGVGRTLISKTEQLINGDNNIILNVAKLPPGSYLVKAVCADGGETLVKKFIKR